MENTLPTNDCADSTVKQPETLEQHAISEIVEYSDIKNSERLVAAYCDCA
jgi:hypothetical protein